MESDRGYWSDDAISQALNEAVEAFGIPSGEDLVAATRMGWLSRRSPARRRPVRLIALLAAAVALTVAATYATVGGWRSSDVSHPQLNAHANITLGFLPRPGGVVQGNVLVIHVTRPDETCVRRYWEGLLIAATYTPPPGKHAASYKIFDGCEGASGGYRHVAPAPAQAMSETVVAKRVVGVARHLSLSPVRLTFYHLGLGRLAVAMTVKAADPSHFPGGVRGNVAVKLFGNEDRFVGTYLRLVNARGDTVWETGWCAPERSGVGRVATTN